MPLFSSPKTCSAKTEAIHQSLASIALLPDEHIVDAGYVDATLLVTSRKQYGVAVVGPVRPNVSWQSQIPGGYDISQFKVNWNTKRVTCPMGKKSLKNKKGWCRINRMVARRRLKGSISE